MQELATRLLLTIAASLALAAPALAQDDPIGRVLDCHAGQEAWLEAAAHNARTLETLEWEPFGRETGWETYVPMTQQEIGTTCAPTTPGFAAALAAFQARYELEADGVFGPATFQVFKGVWQERRPFVMARVRGECPRAPERRELAEFDYMEETARRPGRMVQAEALAAFRRMVADARAQVPEIAADPLLLTVYSTYRHPDIDGVRCEDDRNCDGLRRATCSAHRTGWALDINVGQAPGYGVDSTHPYNRLVQSRGPAYRWLVANAHRYGFVNYIYEPWHWEYVGPGASYAP
ncbi:D-alanyl-D-alanine carboxypeptidase family protein [Brevundimonas sp.]|uniref:D-alanyl-D-alanine carboxypeptidase family protein n=1 Tax=Brevundimonas sp. TaxID=1871086 RepID=UPI0025E55EA4|nr:D-alanyl-D-alanine carboxypeptidase family protein [Brevundimonas sp.]